MFIKNLERIVFTGDSVTDMDRARPVGEGLFENLGRSYVRIIENLLSAYYPEVFIRVTNTGCSGNTSRDLLARYRTDVLDLNPDYVSICIGINDVWRQFDMPAFPEAAVNTEEYRKNLEQMIVMTKDKVKNLFIMSPYYIEENSQDRMRAKMNEYVEICRELSQKHGCEFIDLQKMFEDYCKIRHSSFIAWDRVHPNQIGATLIAKEFLKHIDFDYNH